MGRAERGKTADSPCISPAMSGGSDFAETALVL
jgi:hypothetical protein